MASLYSACSEIATTETKNYLIGNNTIPIEAFESIAAYNLATPSTDQNAIVLIKSNNITIDLGQTLTVANPKKSLVLFCDVLTNNGTISMTGKGPNVLPHDYCIFFQDNVFEDVTIPAYANNQLQRKSVTLKTTAIAGLPGSNGVNRNCGSGGQGAAINGNTTTACYKQMGATGSGYAFGGGAGGGGKAGIENMTYESDVDVNSVYPMIGSRGYTYSRYAASGGVGSPAGAQAPNLVNYNYSGHNGVTQPQNTGVGGRIIIFCNTFINNGIIEAKGTTAYSSDLWASASGGSSGGGAIDIFYADSCQQGTVTATGGASGNLCGQYPNGEGQGGKGGDGSITISQLNYRMPIGTISDEEKSKRLKRLYLFLSKSPSLSLKI